MLSRTFKVFAIMFSAAVIVFSSAAADGAPTLPKPTGDHAVGRVTYHLVDVARKDEWGSHKDHKREFMVQVWYPAPSGSKGKPAPWLPAEWARLEENAIIGRPLKRPAKEVGDFLASVVSHAQEGVPLASSPKRFPVILLAPGSLSFPSEYSSFAEDLASHGFVVVGDVATGNIAAVSFPAGNVTRTYRGKDIFAEWAGDLIYEMNQLEVWNKTEGHLFFGRLDLDHIGAFGHSAGGMIVSRIPHMDKRVKAIVLNDPGYVRPEDGEAIPTLILKSEHRDSENNREKTKSETEYAQKAKPGIRMKLVGGDHVNFGDLPLIMTFAHVAGDGKALNDTVRTVLREFFGQYLLGKHSELIEKGSAKYPLLKIEARY
jgi:predicted dienelactone hydrolase